MRIVFISLAIVVASLVAARDVDAQDISSELTSGTHFRVGFIHPDRAPGEPPANSDYCVVIHARENATVHVGDQIVVITAGTSQIVRFPHVDVIEISSNRPISVTTYQEMLGNGEQSWHLPTSVWGRSYRAFAWWTDRQGLDSASMQYATAKRLIIANEDATRVTVETATGQRDTVLDAGDFWLISEVLDTTLLRQDASDPTGLAITADKPIGVVAGHAKAAVLAYPDGLPMTGPYARPANRCRGNLHDVMLPESMAGTEFVTHPMLYTPTRERGTDLSEQGIGDDRGDVIRIVALHDSTQVFRVQENGAEIVEATLSTGKVYTVSRVESPTVWKTSRPALMMQYGKSYGRIVSQASKPEDDPTTDAGMPLLMPVPAVDRWISHSTVRTRADMFNVIAVAARLADADKLRFGDRPLAGISRLKAIPGTPYCVMTVIVPEGTFSLSSLNGQRFACWTYGSLDGFQLGKIYGSAAGIDVHLECSDSISLTSRYDQSSNQIIVNAALVWKSQPCSQLAMLYVDENAADSTWNRLGTELLIRPASAQNPIQCKAIAVSTSGRRDTLMIQSGGVHVSDDAQKSQEPAVFPNPVDDIAHITNLSSLIGERLTIHSANGTLMHSARIEAARMAVSVSSYPAGVYLLCANAYIRVIVKM